MEHAKHIIRAVLLLVVVAVVFVLVRHFLIPESFGLHGNYRFDNVAEHASIPLVHGAPGVCDECHTEEAQAKTAGNHASVSCEVCHGPLRTHPDGDGPQASIPVDRSFRLCAHCHQHLVSRPKEFPQVVIPDHVIENGAQMGPEVCLDCHDDPHNPSE